MFGRLVTPPTSVGLRPLTRASAARGLGGRARRKPPSSLTRNTGSPTDVFNDKGHHCPLRFGRVQTGKRVWDPLSRERQRLGSVFAVRSPSSPPFYPVRRDPLPAHSIPRLWLGETRPAADPELVCSRRTPLAPCAFRFTTSGTAAGVDTGFGRTGFKRVADPKTCELLASGRTPTPRPPAQNSKLWPAVDFGRAVNGGENAATGTRNLPTNSP